MRSIISFISDFARAVFNALRDKFADVPTTAATLREVAAELQPTSRLARTLAPVTDRWPAVNTALAWLHDALHRCADLLDGLQLGGHQPPSSALVPAL